MFTKTDLHKDTVRTGSFLGIFTQITQGGHKTASLTFTLIESSLISDAFALQR